MEEKTPLIERSDDYKRLINRHAPHSPVFKNAIFAFLTGGFLCFTGEWIAALFLSLGMTVKYSYMLVSIIYIVAAALATALGFFDKVARVGGAGTLVPVTGFSNAVTSCAIDTRSEGYIGGVGTKIFSVAGPVILYSTLAGTLYGLIYYIVITVSSMM